MSKRITFLKKQNPLIAKDDSIVLTPNKDGTTSIEAKTSTGDFVTKEELLKELEKYADKDYVNDKDDKINKKWNESVGYNDTGAYYMQVRNIEKEFTGFKSLFNYFKEKFKTRSNYIARGGIIIYETDNTSQPYWLPFEISGSSEPDEAENMIITFAPLNKEVHINGKLKMERIFSLKMTFTDIIRIDCFKFDNDTPERYLFDDDMISYFNEIGRITLTSAFGLNFSKIDWSV